MLAKKCYFVGIFILFSLSLVIADPPAVHPTTGEDLVIECLRGTVTIDGDLSDWNLEAMTPAVLDAVEQLSSGQASWDNVGDCGGAFYMLWDDENIYIAAVVTDDKLSMNKTDGDIWNADCIEVLFSTTDAEAVHSWTNPTIHYQYGFNANDQIWNWCNMDGPGQSVPDYLQAASSITADGYICEVSIPHSEITPLDWSVGSIIGFHPCIDDTDIDNGDTEFQMSWTGLPAHDQSLGFGHMVLSADSVPAPEPAHDMEIGFVIQPPVIDGEADGIWADASMQYFVPLDDPANASGSWQVLYDYENLYVLVDMTDDSLQNDSSSSWQDDSVEVYFDGGNTKLDTPLSGDDHQYTFAWTTEEIQGVNIDGATEGFEHAQVDTDTGWRIEIKMPWLSIQGVEPQAGDLIGIDCYYNDDDDGGDSRENKLLSFSAVEGWNDASQWGTAVLATIPEPVDPGTDGLVAFYALDGDPNDSSGNEHNGTIVGDPNFVEGQIGMALDLDGTDDVVELGKFDVVGGITLATWIKPDDFGINDARIITKAKEWGGDDHWWMLSTISETSLRFRLKTDEGPTTATLISDPVLEAGVFAHVAATWDGSMMRIYKDGIEIASQEKGGTAVAVDPNISVAIGSQPSDAFASDPSHVAKFFDGLIDEVQIYERALSEDEILYLAGFRADVENLAPNPSFEEDEAVLDDPDWYQWCTWNPAEGAGSNATIVDTDSVDGAKSLRVEPVGVENWHFILVNISFPADLNKNYTAGFWAKAEAPRPLTVQMKASDNSVSEWGATGFELTTEWAEYSYTSEVLHVDVKLEFLCAGSEVPFLLDLVSVYEAD